jgi:hypothetical protein
MAKNDMISFFAQNFCGVTRGDRAAGFSRKSSALARSTSSGSIVFRQGVLGARVS